MQILCNNICIAAALGLHAANLFLNLRCPVTEQHHGVHAGKLRGVFVSVTVPCVSAACLVNPVSLNWLMEANIPLGASSFISTQYELKH